MALAMTRFRQPQTWSARRGKNLRHAECLKERCWPAGPGFAFFFGDALDVDDVCAGLCEDVV